MLKLEMQRNQEKNVEIPVMLYKHRHQRCKAPSLGKTFFHTNICQWNNAGQKKYLSHNDFLTTSFSQHLSHNVFFTSLPLHIPHNVVLSTSQYAGNLSLLYKCPNIYQIRLSSLPCYFNILWSIKLNPRRWKSKLYIHLLCEVSESKNIGFIPKCRGQSVV